MKTNNYIQINMQTAQLSPNSFDFFEHVIRSSKQIQAQIYEIDKMREIRIKKYNDCLHQYSSYIKKQEELINRNIKHCDQRNKWFRQEVDQSWKNAISNRPLVLRSIARTNVLKKDIDAWLSRIDERALRGQKQQSFYEPEKENSLQGSQLIDKYNQILAEYGHRI